MVGQSHDKVREEGTSGPDYDPLPILGSAERANDVPRRLKKRFLAAEKPYEGRKATKAAGPST